MENPRCPLWLVVMWAVMIWKRSLPKVASRKDVSKPCLIQSMTYDERNIGRTILSEWTLEDCRKCRDIARIKQLRRPTIVACFADRSKKISPNFNWRKEIWPFGPKFPWNWWSTLRRRDSRLANPCHRCIEKLARTFPKIDRLLLSTRLNISELSAKTEFSFCDP
jgi:hypothetical protein